MMEAIARWQHWASRAAGRPITFAVAAGLILLWAVSGPLLRFSDTWQLIANTGTTLVTFLLLFLVQGSQNRSDDAMHIKLDELIHVTKEARNTIVGLEDKTEAEIHAARDAITSACVLE